MALSHAILSALTDRPCSGYDLAKQFDGSVGFFWHASHQQIYRELTKLEQQGLVTAEAIAQAGKPDKKVYRVTEAAEADAALLSYLEARGLVPGAKITVLSRSASLDSLTLDGPIGRASLGLRPAALVHVMRGAVDAALFHQIPVRP
jgi:DNA-binding PadR family transcriptional regulator